MEAGIRGVDAASWYRSAPSSPTATETRRDPIASSIAAIHGACVTSKARIGDELVSFRVSCAAQRTRSRTTPSPDVKHGAASACDAGSSTSSSSTFHPSADRRCSSTT